MSPGDHRRHAAECLRIAESVSDPRNRVELLTMAQNWLHLADQAEKNLNTVLVYETPHTTER